MPLVRGSLGRPSSGGEWEALAVTALAAFAQEEAAFVWPEAEAKLRDGEWLTDHVDPDFPRSWGPDPLHLANARKAFIAAGRLVKETVVLSGRPVTAWIDGGALAVRGRRTEVRRLAAAKRRLYRSFLGWTSRAELCGNVAEARVEASLRSLAGTHVWLAPSMRHGRVSRLQGRPLAMGGPLDAAGTWPLDPENPSAGLIPFAVEVKNVRSMLAPSSHEVWELLAKVAAFPEVVPVLVARRIHYRTFRFFVDVGALGVQTKRQWFANRDPIEPARFGEVTGALGFHDAELIDKLDQPAPIVTEFFRTATTPKHGAVEGIAQRTARRWQQTAPIVGHYLNLRRANLPGGQRQAIWASFFQDMAAAGLDEKGEWA